MSDITRHDYAREMLRRLTEAGRDATQFATLASALGRYIDQNQRQEEALKVFMKTDRPVPPRSRLARLMGCP